MKILTLGSNILAFQNELDAADKAKEAAAAAKAAEEDRKREEEIAARAAQDLKDREAGKIAEEVRTNFEEVLS